MDIHQRRCVHGKNGRDGKKALLFNSSEGVITYYYREPITPAKPKLTVAKAAVIVGVINDDKILTLLLVLIALAEFVYELGKKKK